MLKPYEKEAVVRVVKIAEGAGAIEFMFIRRCIIFGLGFSAQIVYAQKTDSVGTKSKYIEFEYLFSYYNQSGNNSAVTGGQGTEELTVYMNDLNSTHVIDSTNQVVLSGGIDVISSASTDNIDFIVSSESMVDYRVWISAGYQKQLSETKDLVGIKPSFSIESDYTSWGINAWWYHKNQTNTKRFGINFQAYFDDLRWGRLSANPSPKKLIYPIELVDSAWFDIYMRYSYNLQFDIQRDINKRTSIGFFPGISLQKGLLSTPFHRVYFKDSTVAVVENLPRNRIKIPLGLQLNTFVGLRTILRFYYRFYSDDFGINAHTFSVEAPIKVSLQVSVIPFGRFYTQSQTRYFYKYQQAEPSELFYTSDFDLSQFSSYKLGIGINFLPIQWKFINSLGLRYAYYKRTNGLMFQQLSSAVLLRSN